MNSPTYLIPKPVKQKTPLNFNTGDVEQCLIKVKGQLGLLDSTSNKHKANGTISLFDPLMGCHYTLHTNGYLRRVWFRQYPRGKKYVDTDALNPKVKCLRKFYHSPRGNTYFESTMLTMLTVEEMLALLVKRVLSYRTLCPTKNFQGARNKFAQ